MKTKILTLALLLISIWGYGQTISNVNFDIIKENIQDPTSQYYYPILTNRLIENDTTLTYDDFKHLYYGNIYTDNYRPYTVSNLEEEFNNVYVQKRFSEALEIGKKVLRENPINLNLTFSMLVCYYESGKKDTAKIFADKYFSLLNVIYQSGDGKSISTAFVVININDEYQVLSDLELNIKGQALLNGPTDKLIIDKKGQKRVKGQKKIKELYFNISKPIEHMKKQLGKINTTNKANKQ